MYDDPQTKKRPNDLVQGDPNAPLRVGPQANLQPEAQPVTPPSPDPFASMGGGVFKNGGWLPKGHPGTDAPTNAPIPNLPPGLAQPMGTPISAQPPGITPPSITGELPADPSDPFTSMGGGVKLANGDWVPKGHPAAQGAPTSAQPPGITPPTTPGQPPVPTTVSGAFQQALLQKLTQDPSNVSTSSPELKGAIDAGRLADQRSGEIARAKARERQVAQGITGGGSQVELEGLDQQRGEAAAMRESGLVGNLAKERRNELLQVMALAGNQLSQEEARALQRELAELDASIRREGIAQQGALGGQELGLRDKLGSGQLNLGLLGLLQNNDQFGKQLGANVGMFGANLNQQALLSLLGGL